MNHTYNCTAMDMPCDPPAVGQGAFVKWTTILLAMAFLLLSSTIINEEKLPLINLGPISLHFGDVLFILLLVVGMSLRHLRHIFGLAVFMLLAWHFVSAIYGIVFVGNNATRATGELRMIMGYALFFPVYLRLGDDEDARKLFHYINLLAIFVSLAMFLQYVLGSRVAILPGRVEDLESMGKIVTGVTRLLPPGQTLIFFCLTHAVTDLALLAPGSRWWKFVRIAIFGFAILLTFNRSYWASLMLSTTFLLALSGVRRLMYGLLTYMAIAVVAVSLLMVLPESRLSQALLARADTLLNIGGTVKKDDSLRYREMEYKEAWNTYIERPFLGIGVGNVYRKLPQKFESLERYTHNGYLWALLKTGIPGILLYIALFLVILLAFFGNLRRINSAPTGTWIKGNFSFLLSVYAGCFVNPLFYQRFSVPFIALSLAFMATGLNGICNRQGDPAAS